VALQIDFAGDDAYEATSTGRRARRSWARPPDRTAKAMTSYVSREWAQGAAVLGTALFLA